jgi:acyl-coenzyme A thioesterase PaaI-like protein
MAHGGIISTLLDETMSWALIYFCRTFFVTRKMDLKYVRPVLIGEPLTVAAKITGSSPGPTIEARAELRDRDRRLLVKGSGEFVVLAPDKLAAVPAGLKKDMQSLFERLG